MSEADKINSGYLTDVHGPLTIETGARDADATSLALISLYKSPSVALSEISRQYFGISPEEANKRAAKQALPVPTFRLTDSQKAPLMVSCEELGNYIDQRAEEARKAWEHVQI